VNLEDARKFLHEASADLEAIRPQADDAILHPNLHPDIAAAWEIARESFRQACADYVAASKRFSAERE
jgi:hypothetical protein